ncbi:WAT1-related protein [Hibiscus syriacus]|uniref:WAT1-related protein n=1 Tax=Hibiscus syriacus TaxID=106335 RepID=A0A6A3BJE1_HIBSY|nr:WAT1-related protein [Hibiscus syriacus]
MARRKEFRELVLPSIAMAGVECSTAVVNILMKAASSKGMSYCIFVVYCYILGTLVFLLLASLFKSKTALRPLKFPLFWRIFLLGLVGCSSQLLFYNGIQFSSPTLGSANGNLVPAFTFILAVLFRLSSGIAVVSVLYSGLFGFPFLYLIHIWGVRLKGPVYVASFKPTQIVIAVVISVTFLGEAIFLGRVIGSLVFITGLYCVLWGKAKEEQEMEDDDSGLSTIDGRVPLLQGHQN